MFPKLQPTSWNSGTRLNGRSKQPEICLPCWRENKQHSADLKKFLRMFAEHPLRAFDPFGGVGAFALSMQEAVCLKLTHAVEISPSAALTLKYVYRCIPGLWTHHLLRKNSPNTKVLNQCSNLVLEDAVKRVRAPNSTERVVHPQLPYKHPSLLPLPAPPTRGEIDCIIAGFPWSVFCYPFFAILRRPMISDTVNHTQG